MATAKTPKSPATVKAAAPVAKSAGAAAAPAPENEITETPVVETVAAAPAPAPSPKPAAKAVTTVTTVETPSFDSVVAGFEDLMQEAKANAEVMVKVSNSLAAGLQKMAHELIEFSSERFESGVAAGKALAGSASVQDFIELSQSAAKDGLDKILDEGSKIRSFSTKLVEDSFAPLQKRVTAVVDKFTHAA